MNVVKNVKLKFIIIASCMIAAVSGLTGCATTTSLGECAAESMNPTVMAALDSFESAAMAIRISNHVLQDIPIAEWDEWPSKLYGAPSGAGMLKMGLSILGSTQGVTIPTEMDPETGFPRPTSALYIFLKERETMLKNLNNKDDIKWFAKKPKTVINRDPANQPGRGKNIKDAIDKNIYRNSLMAYGVVTANKNAVMELQTEIDRVAKGYKTCTYFINKNTEADETKFEALKKEACPDLSMKDDDVKAKLQTKVSEKQEEKAAAEKAYGKLANKVYNASVAGADFSAAATTKLVCAVVNGIRAMPNIKNEFSGLKGAYNIATAITRAKNAIKSIGVFKDNIGFQWTVYKAMYQQIKGTYEIKDDEPTKQALKRIQDVELALSDIEPKIQMALAGVPVNFDNDITRLNALAARFPDYQMLETPLVAALQ